MEKSSLQEWIDFKDKIVHMAHRKKNKPTGRYLYHSILEQGGGKLLRLVKCLYNVDVTQSLEYVKEEEKVEPYEDLISKLTEYFRAKKTPTAHRMAFYSMAQRDNETIAAFIDRMTLVIMNGNMQPEAYNTMMIDRIALTAKVQRIRDEACADGIELSDLLKFVNKIEAQLMARELVREPGHLGSEGGMIEKSDTEQVAAIHSRQQCRSCGNSRHTIAARCPAIDRRCDSCDEVGHFARCCVKRRFHMGGRKEGFEYRQNSFDRRNNYSRQNYHDSRNSYDRGNKEE